jgi:hypothetical protein
MPWRKRPWPTQSGLPGFHSLKLHEIDLTVIRAAREEAGSDVEVKVA